MPFYLDPIRGPVPLHVPHISRNPVPKPHKYSAWEIAQNHGTKPSVTIRTGNSDQQGHRLEEMLTQATWSDEVVTSFMVSVIREQPRIFQVQNGAKAWISYGKELAAANALVDPLCVLTVNEEAAWENVQGNNFQRTTPDSRLSAFWALLLVYQKTQMMSTNTDYGLQIADRLVRFFQANGCNMSSNETQRFAGVQGEDKMTDGYKKLICAIDMFFFKYSNATFSHIRIATRSMRYNGTACSTFFGHIANLMGISPRDLRQLALTKPVAKDVESMFEHGEDENTTGYFPYAIEMGMRRRSNPKYPTLYLWLHTIGVMLGSLKSARAKFPTEGVVVVGTANSAIAVALSFMKRGGHKYQIATKEHTSELMEAASLEYERDFALKEAKLVEQELEVLEAARQAYIIPRVLPNQYASKENLVAAIADDIARSLITNKGLTAEEYAFAVWRSRPYRQVSFPSRDDTVGSYLARCYWDLI